MTVEEKEKLIESLSQIERKVLPFLPGNVDSIEERSGLDRTTILRALEFLKNKKLVNVNVEERRVVDLGVNGIYYQKKGLPERKLLDILGKKEGFLLREIKNLTGLNDNEAKVSVGVLKKKALAEIKEGRIVFTGTKEEVAKKMLEELLLEGLPRDLEDLKPEEKLALKNLQDRKEIIELKEGKNIETELTELGKEISQGKLDVALIEKLNMKMIKTATWKGKKFRRYDILGPVPKVYGGKRHFVNQSTDYAKKIWLEMGFKEMAGSLVQTGFWNFDALFTAQDHPVREEQDTFYIKDLKGKLPADKPFIEAVKKSHEGGNFIAGGVSKGWGSDWHEEEPKKVLLRTHTTCLSAQTLKKIAEDVKKGKPAKYFALGKCFRNETVDWSHGFEFNQTEGIVVEENANFRQLLGYLVEFFKKMGYEKIRIRPGYFPYTEPSLEIDVFHPERKCWVELGGAGMFRPELTVPIFGKHVPVLAWGPGVDRIIMEYFGIKDLREMYKNNITKLRDIKFWTQ